jgi:hypothetical protein
MTQALYAHMNNKRKKKNRQKFKKKKKRKNIISGEKNVGQNHEVMVSH